MLKKRILSIVLALTMLMVPGALTPLSPQRTICAVSGSRPYIILIFPPSRA